MTIKYSHNPHQYHYKKDFTFNRDSITDVIEAMKYNDGQSETAFGYIDLFKQIFGDNPATDDLINTIVTRDSGDHIPDEDNLPENQEKNLETEEKSEIDSYLERMGI